MGTILLNNATPISVLLFAELGHESHGDPTISEIESRRSLVAIEPDGPIYESWQNGLARMLWVPRALREAYKIPICREGHPTIHQTRVPNFIPYKIQRNETLRHAVDKYTDLVDGVYEWRWIGDVPFIGPPLDKEGKTGTCFDTVVSLDLDSVSAWDAFVALTDVIQANQPSGVPLLAVQPQCTAELLAPPSEFFESGSITLNLSNVPAREAACAIISASPIEMYFVLANGAEYAYLSLFFTEDGKHLSLDRMTEAEFQFWQEEHERVNSALLEHYREKREEERNATSED